MNTFNTEEFRDRFHLSKQQADLIIHSLQTDVTPEGGLQQKFFKVKKYIENSLYNEMDLRGSKQEIVLDFPPGSDTWGENAMCCGASSSGKTYLVVQKFLRNLEGPEKDRRQFVIISNEWEKDKTLSLLKKEKYRKYLTGIDVSERSLEMSQHATAQEYFDKEVKPHIEYAEKGTVIFCDDPVDSCVHLQLRKTINRMLRTSRHDAVSLIFVLHSIRSGIWSAQASSSCKYFILFPRSQRGKVRDFLNKEIGLTLAESREAVQHFAQSGRGMTVRLFSPQCLIGTNRLELI